MSIKIRTASDPVDVRTLVLLLYGQPGIGKTSTAFTTDRPLLLDFDRGAHRSANRRDHVVIESWSDVDSLTESDLEPYDSVSVDTVGRALDSMTVDMIRRTPKLDAGGGALSLRGWGQLKTRFATWLATVRSYGLDVVLLAHDRENRDGDTVIVRPDVQGGSYGEVFRSADAVAYMRSDNGRKLEFSPSDRWLAKNPAALEPVPVPSPLPGDFLAELLGSLKEAIAAQANESQKIAATVAKYRDAIAESSTSKEFGDILEHIGDESRAVSIPAKSILWKRAKDLGFDFDAKEKLFVPPPESDS